MAKARKKKEPVIADGNMGARQLSPLTYDPVEPQYNALHRAGMVGLALQIEAMKIRNRVLAKDQASPVPELNWLEQGRSMKVTFSYESFEELLQERYLGAVLPNNKTPKKRKSGNEDEQEAAKEVLVPRLRYLEDLGAYSEFQSHIRSAYRASFFSIYKERESFFAATKDKKALAARIRELWEAIVSDSVSEIQKSSRPNIVGYDLKGNSLTEPGKSALLLHFWSLSSWFFTPKTLKYDKRKKELDDDYLPPVIVAPDVTDIRSFFEYVKGSYARPFQRYISTSLEAAMAFYAAPILAHSQSITEEIRSEFHQLVSGATVFVYLRPGKQPEVAGVFNETYDDETLQQYIELQNHEFRSIAYRALRVENLLARRAWYHGFNKLVDHWGLELLVPIKNRKTNAYEMKPKALELAKDLAADFLYFADMEDEMESETRIALATIPTIIDELVTNYLDWRVYAKGQNPPDKKEMDNIFERRGSLSAGQSLTDEEEEIRKNYNQLKKKIVNQEFVAFRGATDQKRFAESFIGMFEAGFHLEPKEREVLRPFYEGDQWESGRWLTLMAISAAGAPRRTKKKATSRAGNTDDADKTKKGN